MSDVSTLLPLGKHFYQNITLMLFVDWHLHPDESKQLSHSSEWQGGDNISQTLTLLCKTLFHCYMTRYTPTSNTLITFHQDIWDPQTLRSWLCQIMDSPVRVFLISQHLKTSIYNLVWVLTSRVACCVSILLVKISANQRASQGPGDQSEAGYDVSVNH